MYSVCCFEPSLSFIIDYDDKKYLQRAIIVQKYIEGTEAVWKKTISFSEENPSEFYFFSSYLFVQNIISDSADNLYLFGEYADYDSKSFRFKTLDKMNEPHKYRGTNRVAFLMKINENGEVLWTKTFQLSSSKNYLSAVDLEIENNQLKLLVLKRESSKNVYQDKPLPNPLYFWVSSYRFFDQFRWLTISPDGDCDEKNIVVQDLQAIVR
jgi:hypothetical protein